jgi:aryl-alcohol dehydrogenase-like predicted oxidoreductase
LDEAAAWAAEHCVVGFVASSPNLSLAVPVVPPWPGCLSASTPADLAWYERTRRPLLSWSSLGRGYVTDEPSTIEPDVLAAFDSAENRRRRERACRLALELDVSPASIALAWVLGKPFPTAAVVGCRSIAELEDVVEAERLRLTAPQVAWLAG